jgi:hypothetical protein
MEFNIEDFDAPRKHLARYVCGRGTGLYRGIARPSIESRRSGYVEQRRGMGSETGARKAANERRLVMVSSPERIHVEANPLAKPHGLLPG